LSLESLGKLCKPLESPATPPETRARVGHVAIVIFREIP